jgi:hypothetical protein
MTNPQFGILQKIDVWYCSDYEDHIWTIEDDIEEPLYECADCGEFSRRDTENGDHRCPQCNKFGAKLDDYSCPEGCIEAMESGVGYQDPETNEIFVSLALVRGE